MKKRLKIIAWPIIYLLLIIAVCISFVMVFRSYYYRSIFVSGSSMMPTLNGNVSDVVDFGLINDHDSAIKKIKRFQIITTYYPFTDSHDYVGGYDVEKGKDNVIDQNEASYKIKRVYGMPYETIKFVVDKEEAAIALEKTVTVSDALNSEEVQYHCRQAIQFYIKGPNQEEFVKQELKFKRRINPYKIAQYDDYVYELGENEYWVMGDNYSASSDCFNKKAPIYYYNIVGVLIAIEGTCKIVSDVKIDSTDDGTKVSYRCTNKKYHFPTYY